MAQKERNGVADIPLYYCAFSSEDATMRLIGIAASMI
jgi:hypothetical protein